MSLDPMSLFPGLTWELALREPRAPEFRVQASLLRTWPRRGPFSLCQHELQGYYFLLK